jgi:predicted CXXCH cytochrome family protein
MQSSLTKSSSRRRVLGVLALAGLVVAIVAISGTAFALDRENHDAFCASCHTQPEVAYYQQSVAQNSATLAAFHTQEGVRCIDCHSAAGTFGRAAGLGQGAQDLFAYYGGHYHHPAITTSKLGDGSCLKCHSDVTANRSFNNHFHLFLARWQSVDPNAANCVDCHTSHPTGNPAQAYLAQATIVPVCQDCHQAVGEGR